MSAIMEINMPAGASEVTLKTGGKYCEKDIRVTAPFSHRVVTGQFTPTENKYDSYTIPGVPTDARFVTIDPISELTKIKVQEWIADQTKPVSLSHAAWVGAITKSHYSANGGIIQYVMLNGTADYPGNAKVTAKLDSNGLTFTLSGLGGNYTFEAGKTYEWTAHFFND